MSDHSKVSNIPEIAAIQPRVATLRLMIVIPVIRLNIAITAPMRTKRATVITTAIPPRKSERL
jgi:hypothetical protein